MLGCSNGKSALEHGVIVVAPDYRNFPQARVGEMLEDVDAAVQWVFRNIKSYGGDTGRIFLSGQSAGAHLHPSPFSLTQKAIAAGAFAVLLLRARHKGYAIERQSSSRTST